MKEHTPFTVAYDAWNAKRAGLPGILERQQVRLKELVAFARENSRYYAEKYSRLPAQIEGYISFPLLPSRN